MRSIDPIVFGKARYQASAKRETGSSLSENDPSELNYELDGTHDVDPRPSGPTGLRRVRGLKDIYPAHASAARVAMKVPQPDSRI